MIKITAPREHTREIAREMARRILEAERDRVVRIILYGSRARGDAREDSDFDLLVVARDLVESDSWDEAQRIRGALGDLRHLAEVRVMSVDWYEATKDVVGGLAYPAHREGVHLHG